MTRIALYLMLVVAHFAPYFAKGSEVDYSILIFSNSEPIEGLEWTPKRLVADKEVENGVTFTRFHLAGIYHAPGWKLRFHDQTVPLGPDGRFLVDLRLRERSGSVKAEAIGPSGQMQQEWLRFLPTDATATSTSEQTTPEESSTAVDRLLLVPITEVSSSTETLLEKSRSSWWRNLWKRTTGGPLISVTLSAHRQAQIQGTQGEIGFGAIGVAELPDSRWFVFGLGQGQIWQPLNGGIASTNTKRLMLGGGPTYQLDQGSWWLHPLFALETRWMSTDANTFGFDRASGLALGTAVSHRWTTQRRGFAFLSYTPVLASAFRPVSNVFLNFGCGFQDSLEENRSLLTTLEISHLSLSRDNRSYRVWSWTLASVLLF